MIRFAAFACLALAAGCAPRQEYRSSAEAACAAEAERLVLDRNRARSMRLDSPETGARTIMEETNISTRFARESEYAERQRLTRACLERLGRAQTAPGASPPASGPVEPAAQPARRGGAGELPRGTALPPPMPASAAAPSSAPPSSTPATAVRGW
jgi:hypothetical protein